METPVLLLGNKRTFISNKHILILNLLNLDCGQLDPRPATPGYPQQAGQNQPHPKELTTPLKQRQERKLLVITDN